MKKIITLRVSLLAAVLGGAALIGNVATAAPSPVGQQQAAQRANGGAFAAAQRDFAQFVKAQQQGQNRAEFPLDVKSAQELSKAVVSYGFPVYTIDPSDMLAGRGTMKAMAKHTSTWRFVITLADRPIGLATVEKVNGRFQTVAYGAAVLSKDLDALARNYGNADKSNLRFMRIYQARADLLEVAQNDGQTRFAPMHSARQSLALQQGVRKQGAAPADLLDEADLQEPLRTAIKQNLAATR